MGIPHIGKIFHVFRTSLAFKLTRKNVFICTFIGTVVLLWVVNSFVVLNSSFTKFYRWKLGIPTKKQIFFIQTTRAYLPEIIFELTARQACTVESVARMNPNSEINVFFVSHDVRMSKPKEHMLNDVLKQLVTYKNVNLRHINLQAFMTNTPVESLYISGELFNSGFLEYHTSDVLRALTLWKYGGIYLDLDFVFKETLETFPDNFGALESEESLAAGALGFSRDGFGHSMATKLLQDLRDNFHGEDWAYNGPEAINRLLNKTCESVESLNDLSADKCGGFHVFPKETFYPIYYAIWHIYFDVDFVDIVFHETKNSVAIHLWNNLSSNITLPVNAPVAYIFYARKFCPKVFSTCKDFF